MKQNKINYKTMNIEKKVIKNLNKCYSIAPLKYKGEDHFLVAAEKQDPCYLFTEDGELVDKIWDGPGGVMTMVQVPGSDGEYLSTYKFYSPNDSKEAKIVLVSPPEEEGDWDVKTLVDLPHVHRFDILERDGHNYLIACTLKSGHEYRDDWTHPGKIYVAELPDDLSQFNDDNQLELTVLKEGLTKNHGYYKVYEGDVPTSVISSDEGVIQVTPPANGGNEWEVKELITEPTSDAVLIDLDQDGEKELCALQDFHGNKISIYRPEDGEYVKVYEFPEEVPFLHAIGGFDLAGKPSFVTGNREGERYLMAITYDKDKDDYVYEMIDQGAGPANIYHFVKDGIDKLVATNRETDEIALYTITE